MQIESKIRESFVLSQTTATLIAAVWKLEHIAWTAQQRNAHWSLLVRSKPSIGALGVGRQLKQPHTGGQSVGFPFGDWWEIAPA